MTHDFLLGGVIITTVVPAVLLALVATAALSVLLTRLGFFRFVWQRPLAEVAMFCIVLGLIVRLVPGI